MKNARGFSLVEIMVVTALSTVVIAGVVTMVTNVSAQTDLVLQKQDMDQIVQEVTAALLNRDICTSNLRGLNLSNGSTPDTINSIRYLQPDGTPGATIANIGLSRKGLRIDAITIVPAQSLGKFSILRLENASIKSDKMISNGVLELPTKLPAEIAKGPESIFRIHSAVGPVDVGSLAATKIPSTSREISTMAEDTEPRLHPIGKNGERMRDNADAPTRATST